MTDEQITKAFNGRWRMKADLPVAYIKGVRALCRDFFEAGILIAESQTTVQCEANLPPESFTIWWKLYDKKRGREKCIKKWNRLSAAEQQACIDATPAYVASTPDVTFRKDPITYLNQKAWQDEIYFRQTPYLQRQQRLAESANLVAKYAGAGQRDTE